MLFKKRVIIIVLCVAFLIVGFITIPIHNLISRWDYSYITDSTYVITGTIDVANLNTPLDGYHAWISPKGNLYMGVWKNGMLGKGVLVTEKSVYEGELQNLSPHGYGIMYYNNGNIYRGNWIVGNKEGIGLMHNKDGSMFFGHWRAGLFNVAKNAKYKTEESVYGIDISSWQQHEKIKWNELALYSDANGDVYSHETTVFEYMQPVTFAYIRATSGCKKDSSYLEHMENARKYKVTVGAYHFFTINENVDDQINIYINTVKYERGDLPPILDLENEYSNAPSKYLKELRQYGVKKMQEGALKWLKAIEQHYQVKPIIYTNEKWKEDFLNDKRFDEYNFWYARYFNVKPKSEHNWIFWQRTDRARPHGYLGDIDVNIFNGTFNRFMEFRKSNYTKIR